MIDPAAYAYALVAMLTIALIGWAWSVRTRNVTIVDALWAIFFAAGLAVYAVTTTGLARPARSSLVVVLVVLWAVRLSGYMAWRNSGKPEDHRYAAMRRRNEPFALKSLYIVFGLQALIAWVVATPLAAAYTSSAPLGVLDGLGLALWIVGFASETIGDAQLARFKSDPDNRGKVMERGLWRYTRHPNYFGEACLWWGFWLIAAGAGGAWTVFAPLIMTWLLLRISGVALLERDITERRPAYRDYMTRTNAFLPGPPRKA